MGDSADQIDRQIRETREHIDENLTVLEQRATSNAVRYGRIAAVLLGVAAAAGAGVLIYRRMTRLSRKERLQRMLIEALRDLPDSVRGLPDDLGARIKQLPRLRLVASGEAEDREPGTLHAVVRKLAPGLVGSTSRALIDRFIRPSDAARPAQSSAAPPPHD